MRNLRPGLLRSAGARVVALIIFATLPLAAVSGVLAWHAYQTAVIGRFDRQQADLFFVRSLLIDEVYRTRLALETFSSEIAAHSPAIASLPPYVSSLCRLRLLSEDGTLIRRFETRASVTPDCLPGHPNLTIKGGIDLSISPSSTFINAIQKRVFIGFALRTTYPLPNGQTGSGILEGVKYLPVAAALDYSRLALGEVEPSFMDLWLVVDDVAEPIPLIVANATPAHWSSEAVQRIQGDLHQHRGLDHFRDGRMSFTVVPLLDKRTLVAMSRLQPKEARALDLFLARVAFIALMLVIELFLVALAAHFYLVSPLSKLSESVDLWQRTGRFDPVIPPSTPREIYQMFRAFKRATGNLNRHEADLVRASREQEVLIKEIHHRVKNNLQIVASLLNLQAKRIRQPEARHEFHEIRERVRVLATLHRHLYPDGGAAILELEAFLGELARQLYMVYASQSPGRVDLSFALDHVSVSADQAVPIALVTTEVLINAFCHAFPEGRVGAVEVRLKQCDDFCRLTILDNGIGFDVHTQAPADGREQLGLKLISGFSKQLGGEYNISSSDKGTIFDLTFQLKPVKRVTLLKN